MAGNREKDWGKEKKFREGQSKQVLDTLFFDFIDLAKRLQPKVVIAENVKGILQGTARNYYRRVLKEMDEAGYYSQAFLLDASKMGVPQRRERVFFIGLRKDLAAPFLYQHDMFTVLPRLDLKFDEMGITFGEFYQSGLDDRPCGKGKMFEYWQKKRVGDKHFADTTLREYGKELCFQNTYIYRDHVCPTITANSSVAYLFDEFRLPNKSELCSIGSFPQDYEFSTAYSYLIGMSVPPVMTAQIASRIWTQWLSKI
jgi:DNA (cytosine-5)-methyltransferase 1